MKVYNKEEFLQSEHSLRKKMKESVFIYPTDSIYSLGCDATNPSLVQRLRELKNSSVFPFSVIAPSKEWIHQHCIVSGEAKKWVDKLDSKPMIIGKKSCVSVILKLKNKRAVAPNVVQGSDSLSIRLPPHWFTQVIAKNAVPLVMTSANPTGGDIMTSIDDVHPRILHGVDFIVYEGVKKGKPSTLVTCDDQGVCVKKR